MDSEHVPTFVHGICQFFHIFPATGFFTCRQVIRMLVVISRLCPAIQMEIQLFHSLLMKFSDFFCTLCKSCQMIVLFRILRIKEIGVVLHLGFDSLVSEGTSDQIVDGRVSCRLFFQGS